MTCVCICYLTSVFGRLGRGPGTLSVVRKFCFALVFCAIVLILIGPFQQTLTLSEDLRVRKTAESVQMAKNVELEALMNSQDEKSLSLRQRMPI
jgi:hypothetical protein